MLNAVGIEYYEVMIVTKKKKEEWTVLHSLFLCLVNA